MGTREMNEKVKKNTFILSNAPQNLKRKNEIMRMKEINEKVKKKTFFPPKIPHPK
jgi:hypothetical protein